MKSLRGRETWNCIWTEDLQTGGFIRRTIYWFPEPGGEEKLLGKRLEKVLQLRRMLDLLNEDERTELLIAKMKKTKNNDEFLESLTKAS